MWPTSRISRLYHELFDDPVKDVSIVVTITTVYTEILYRLWAAEDIKTNKQCVISALYVTTCTCSIHGKCESNISSETTCSVRRN